MKKIIVSAALLFSACTIQYNLQAITLVAPDACITAGDKGGLEIAVKAWNGQGAGLRLTLNPGEVGTATIPISCLSGSDIGPTLNGIQPVGDYNWTGGNVTVNENVWPNMTAAQQTDLIAHELGHAYGLEHVLDTNATMFWLSHDFNGFSKQDALDISCAQSNIDCSQVDYDNANH